MSCVRSSLEQNWNALSPTVLRFLLQTTLTRAAVAERQLFDGCEFIWKRNALEGAVVLEACGSYVCERRVEIHDF